MITKFIVIINHDGNENDKSMIGNHIIDCIGSVVLDSKDIVGCFIDSVEIEEII